MRVNPGKLNKKIEIVEITRTQNANGYWTDPVEHVVHRCWAQFSRTSGKELRRNDADYSEISVRFLIRWTSKPISRKMLVLYRGQRYEILYLNNYGDSNDYIEIVAKLMSMEG